MISDTITQFNSLQQEQWREDGCVLLKNILSKEEVTTLLQAVDNTIKEYVKQDPVLKTSNSSFGEGAFKILRAIEKTDALDVLIDFPRIFKLLVSLMGPYLQVMSTEIFVRHPKHDTSERFHTDAGPSMQKILPNEQTPPLQFKVQLFLTDIPAEDCGNFMFIPGSHRKHVSVSTKGCYIPEANFYLDNGNYPPNTVQLLAKAGDVLIFPWALWHGVSKNLSNQIRRSVCFRYGQLWCRPHDYTVLPEHVLSRLSRRQKRLFGDLGEYEGFEPSDYYRPHDQLELIFEG